jgi:pimeloyl-ACP methyl ester carboxylesterase
VQNPWKPSREGQPVIRVPTAVLAFPKEVGAAPKKWTEQYFDLKRHVRLPKGGHYPGIEQPEALARELAAFFGTVG